MPRILRGAEALGRFIKMSSVQALTSGSAYQSFNFYSDNFQPGEGLVEDEELGEGRHNLVDPTEQARDLPNPSGGLTVALDLRQIGFWLSSLWGAPATTGSGPYVHVWTSAVTSPGLLGLELPLANEIFRIVDACAISQMSINLADEAGYRKVQMETVSRSVRSLGAALSASQTAAPERAKVTGTKGILKINDTAFGNVMGGQLQMGNGAFGERYVDDTDYISAIEIGKPSFSLSPQVRIRSGASTMLALFDGVTPFTAEMIYTVGSNTLSILCNNAKAAPVLPSPQGFGGMDVTPAITGSQTADDPMLTITLTNDVVSY